MTETTFNNLMDLATLDTSDMIAQTSRLQKEGIYVLDVQSAGIVEQPAADPALPMNYILGVKSVILAFAALKEEDKAKQEELVGRDFSERYFLYGQEILGAIQQLMGNYKKVGLRHKGVMGGVEGSEPGWIDEIVGKRIVVRVRQYQNKNQQDVVAYDWLTPKQMEKAELSWDILGRDFLDEKGNVVEGDITKAA